MIPLVASWMGPLYKHPTTSCSSCGCSELVRGANRLQIRHLPTACQILPEEQSECSFLFRPHSHLAIWNRGQNNRHSARNSRFWWRSLQTCNACLGAIHSKCITNTLHVNHVETRFKKIDVRVNKALGRPFISNGLAECIKNAFDYFFQHSTMHRWCAKTQCVPWGAFAKLN